MKKILGMIFVANYSYSGLIHRVTQQSKDHAMQAKSNMPKEGIFKPVVAFYPFALADISPDARSSILASYTQPAASCRAMLARQAELSTGHEGNVKFC